MRSLNAIHKSACSCGGIASHLFSIFASVGLEIACARLFCPAITPYPPLAPARFAARELRRSDCRSIVAERRVCWIVWGYGLGQLSRRSCVYMGGEKSTSWRSADVPSKIVRFTIKREDLSWSSTVTTWYEAVELLSALKRRCYRFILWHLSIFENGGHAFRLLGVNWVGLWFWVSRSQVPSREIRDTCRALPCRYPWWIFRLFYWYDQISALVLYL